MEDQAYGGFFPTELWKGLQRLRFFSPAREIDLGGCCFCPGKRKLSESFGTGTVSIIFQYVHLMAVSSLTSGVFMPGLERGAHLFL